MDDKISTANSHAHHLLPARSKWDEPLPTLPLRPSQEIPLIYIFMEINVLRNSDFHRIKRSIKRIYYVSSHKQQLLIISMTCMSQKKSLLCSQNFTLNGIIDF